MTDRLIRITTALAVAAVAVVAPVISYQHAYELVHSHGESGLTARLLPFTVDGLIWAASMVVLDASRRRGVAVSRSDSRWRERVFALDLDQFVACGRARDDRHLRGRDVGPPRHGTGHGCVCPPPAGGSRTHSWSVEPSHSRRSVRALAWTCTVIRFRVHPLTVCRLQRAAGCGTSSTTAPA